jgi:hypothetical protein
MKRVLTLLLLPLGLLLAAFTDPLQLPATIKFPEFTDSVKVSGALIQALRTRRWLIEADTGESITARLLVRRHMLRIRLDYSPRQVSFHYVDSEALDYAVEDGTPHIHGNANKWLRRLGIEVESELNKLFFARDPALVVPAEPQPPPTP